ncbi:RluA family pseudouridine synthase [Faecalispora anaeroviscerum]|uniref:RluA family pseudouridine synthase n=1 Tax=Faecalispora anaeroviscerum TaxID=2991836 RepID=UPI0024B9BA7C|nr:RluA family pseudouridine synthase [Faecalispora anaeroviscerum]
MIKKEKPRGKNPHAPVILLVNEPGILFDFLRDHLRGKSRNNIKSLLARGAVLVEGRVATRHDYPVRPGQSVQVRWAPEAPPAGGRTLEILYEDDAILVINKPAGLLSIANENEKERTAYHQMTEHVRQSDPDSRIFIVHRLDRDTSGVLLAAKTAEMKYALQDQWATIVKTRAYTAVVEGCPQPLSGQIHTWLHETKTMLVYSGEQDENGLEAITDYKVIGVAPGYSLVDVRLQTGRKNQIRVHMKEMGCPVVGDKKYGAKSNPFKRLGLHAGLLELRHPETGKLLRFEAKVPAVFLSISFKRTDIK